MKTWRALLAVLTALFVCVQIAYRTGAEGVRTRAGATISFGRSADTQLFAVEPDVAVLVSRSALLSPTDELPVVATTPAMFPFSALCGAYDSAGFVRDPEAVRNAPALAGHTVRVEPHPVRGERDRVTVALSPDEALKRLEPLSTCNESCTTFTAAFLLLYLVLLASAPWVWWASRRNTRAGGA